MPNPLDHGRQGSVFHHVQRAILAGAFPAGARLPPTRTLAAELRVARQTVVAAYERLAAEGYLTARTGIGTFVAPGLPDALPDAHAHPVPTPSVRLAAPRLSRRGRSIAATPATAGHDSTTLLLAPGIPAPELFPSRDWAACLAATARATLSAGYPDPQGLLDLRTQLALHLAATRGLAADPHCILITSGTQQGIRIAAEILLDPGDPVWVEDPGYIAGRGALIAAGATLIPIRSAENGLDLPAARTRPARLALVAPSHSTPLGAAMPVAQRLALLDWARIADAWILEDDCDSEFRWTGKPLPPLATLDAAGRTIYLGTFSKTMTPGLRLGFAIFPQPLVPAALRARTLMDRGPPTPIQAAMAEFMRRNLLAPHIRRARTEYAARRQAVLDALARHCPGVRPVPAPGGLHMTLALPDGADDRAVAHAARTEGLGVAPLSAYRCTPGPPGLVVGFAATPVSLAAGCARRLARAIPSAA